MDACHVCDRCKHAIKVCYTHYLAHVHEVLEIYYTILENLVWLDRQVNSWLNIEVDLNKWPKSFAWPSIPSLIVIQFGGRVGKCPTSEELFRDRHALDAKLLGWLCDGHVRQYNIFLLGDQFAPMLELSGASPMLVFGYYQRLCRWFLP